MKIKAFTLAEVLITLAIIGIVAAITIPQLIQNYKKIEYSSKLKKFYSTMQQAIELSTLQNGAVEYWDKKDYVNLDTLPDDASQEEIDAAKATNAKDGFEFVNKYILPYIKYSKIEEDQIVEFREGESYRLNKIYLSDGTFFFTKNGSCIDLIYDVNGDKGPNKLGYDIYTFLFSPDITVRKNYFNTTKLYFSTYGWHDSYNKDNYRDWILEKCETNAYYCSDLIRLDNWEFKDDYPYKL